MNELIGSEDVLLVNPATNGAACAKDLEADILAEDGR